MLFPGKEIKYCSLCVKKNLQGIDFMNTSTYASLTSKTQLAYLGMDPKALAEWIVSPEPLNSVILTATQGQQGQHALSHDIVNIVTKYLQILDTSEIIFGPEDWKAHFGNVEIIKTTPEMEIMLQSQNPLIPGKTIKETCLLVLLPSHINNQPCTPNTINERYYCHILNYFASNSLSKTYWALVTKNFIHFQYDLNKWSEEEAFLIEKSPKINWRLLKITEMYICAFAIYATVIKKLNPQQIEEINNARCWGSKTCPKWLFECDSYPNGFRAIIEFPNQTRRQEHTFTHKLLQDLEGQRII